MGSTVQPWGGLSSTGVPVRGRQGAQRAAGGVLGLLQGNASRLSPCCCAHGAASPVPQSYPASKSPTCAPSPQFPPRSPQTLPSQQSCFLIFFNFENLFY